jgi:hypothetical protein
MSPQRTRSPPCVSVAHHLLIFAVNSTNSGIQAAKRLLKPCYLIREDHNQKIRTRKNRTNVGKYSLVNRTIKCWNQIPAVLRASSSSKLNNYRKRVKNVVKGKGIGVGVDCK